MNVFKNLDPIQSFIYVTSAIWTGLLLLHGLLDSSLSGVICFWATCGFFMMQSIILQQGRVPRANFGTEVKELWKLHLPMGTGVVLGPVIFLVAIGFAPTLEGEIAVCSIVPVVQLILGFWQARSTALERMSRELDEIVTRQHGPIDQPIHEERSS